MPRRSAEQVRRLRKLLALDRAQQALLVKSYGALALARLQVSFGKYSELKLPRDSNQPAPREQQPSGTQLAAARQVSWALRSVAPHTLWQNTCLVQALAARQLLQRRAISCVLFLGVAQDPLRKRKLFHAWLKCGNEFITGEAGHERYRVLYERIW